MVRELGWTVEVVIVSLLSWNPMTRRRSENAALQNTRYKSKSAKMLNPIQVQSIKYQKWKKKMKLQYRYHGTRGEIRQCVDKAHVMYSNPPAPSH